MSMNHHIPPPAPTPLCALYEPLLALLLADELDAEQTRSVRTHLARCPYCQQRLRELERTVAALRHQLLVDDGTAQEGTAGTRAESATFAEPVVEPARTAAPSGTAPGEPQGWAMHAPFHLTLQDIMLASQRAPADSLADSLPEPTSPPTVRAPPGRAERASSRPPPSRLVSSLVSSLGAIAALLLLTLLVSALFGTFRSGRGPAAGPTPTPKAHNPFSGYYAAAPGLPCDQNPQASALWSGDRGECLANLARTRLVAQGHLLAVMRWDASSYTLPDNYTVSVQLTLEGSATAKLQIDLPIANTGGEVTHVIACGTHHCDVDGKSTQACACDTSGPLTLAIVVKGTVETFSVGSVQLATATEVEALRVGSIALGVGTSDPTAQGAQAVFANFAVLAN